MRPAPRSSRLTLLLAGQLVLALAAGAGPARAGIDFWTPIGPDGGAILALAASPAQPGLLFAASNSAGVFRSEDGGSTWVHPSRSPWLGSFALIADPQAPGIVYSIDLTTLEKSVDAGTSWTALESVGASVYSLAIDPQSSGTLYAGLGQGVAKSADGGATWTRLATGAGVITAVAVDPSRPSTVYALQLYPRKLLRSLDSGATWVEVGRGLPPATVFLAQPVLAVDPATVPGTLYLAFLVNGAAATYRSADAGDSWQPAGPGGYPLAVGRGVVYAGAVKSTDGGVTWTPAAASPGTAYVLAAAPGSSTTLYAGTSQGVWRSGDAAASWQAASSGLNATRTQALAIDPLHPRILYVAEAGAVQGSGLLKSSSGGQRWRPVGPPWLADYLGVLVIDPATTTTLYAGSGEGLAKSTDGGNSWEALTAPSGQGPCFGVRRLAIDPAQPATLYVATIGLEGRCLNACLALKSTDGGESWRCLGLAAQISDIAVAASSPSTLYAMGGGVFKSLDGGLTWKEVDAGLHISRHGGNAFMALAIDPTDANRVFVSQDLGVFRTTDGGRTWIELDHKLPIQPRDLFAAANALAIDPHVPAIVYAAGEWDVYRSANGGQSWYPIVGGQPPVAFEPLAGGMLVVDPRQPGKLYAGTLDTGIYTYTVQ